MRSSRYDSFGGPVPSCGQRTVRFEQACVLFNVAAVHTQMGAKYDRRCRDDADDGDDDDYNMSIGSGKRTGSSTTSTGPEAVDGAAAAAQCFLRAAGAYRHIGDTFANAPARAADLRATGVLYALMMVSGVNLFYIYITKSSTRPHIHIMLVCRWQRGQRPYTVRVPKMLMFNRKRIIII